MESVNLLLLDNISEPVALADAGTAEFLWGSTLFGAKIHAAHATGFPELTEFLRAQPVVKEFMQEVREGKTQKEALVFPASLSSWSGTLHIITQEWKKRTVLVILFKSKEKIHEQQKELRRREGLRLLNGSTELTCGDILKAGKLITRVAAETLDAVRVGIWNLEETQLRNVIVYDQRVKEHYVAEPFGVDIYPKYVSLLHTERNITIEDTATDAILPDMAKDFDLIGIRALLDCPVRIGDKLIGVVCIEHADTPRHWSMEEQAFGASIADFVVIALESSRVYESERRMATLISNLPGTAFRCRNDFPTFAMEYMSEGCLEMTGYPPEDIIGNKKMCFFDIVHPEDLEKLKDENVETLLVDKPLDAVFRIIHKNGDIRWIWERSRVVAIDANNPKASIVEGFFSDVTDRFRLKEAEVSSQAKSDFLANMSHEIRTPMNAILGLTYIALQETMPESQRDLFQKIRSAATGLLGIINDVLDFSKIEARKLDLENSSFSLCEHLDSVFDVIKFKADEKKITLEVDMEPSVLAADKLMGDAGRLRQVLLNLLGNAVKFTDAGGVTLTVRTEELTDTHHHVFFAVRDTGIGIGKEALANIFQPFAQADNSITRRFGGTGLGLAICKELVELMGGTMRAESELGAGSTFSFSLSFERAPEYVLPAVQPVTPHMGALPNFTGKRVLLVEDNEINQMIALAMLEQVGVQVSVAANGLEGVEAASWHDFDLVLMDIQMPVMGGLEATRRIRELPNGRAKVPIVAMTAHAMSGDYDKSLASGMDDHITKPIAPEVLFAALGRWMPLG